MKKLEIIRPTMAILALQVGEIVSQDVDIERLSVGGHRRDNEYYRKRFGSFNQTSDGGH